MVPLKSFTHQIIAIGAPNSGKSFWLRRHMWALAQQSGGYLIVHDPTESWTDRAVPTRRYPNVQALARGLAQYGGRVAYALDVEDADDALRAAIALAAETQARAVNGKYHPVCFVADEAVTAGGLDVHALSPLWRNAFARKRHFGIAIGITAQSAYFAARSAITLATRVEVFRTADPADADRLVKVGLDPEIARGIRSMPDRAHVSIINGRTYTNLP